MKVSLVIPRPPVESGGHTINSGVAYSFKLYFRTDHPASHYGLGVLLDKQRQVFDGFMLNSLAASCGAWIETDNAEAICNALGLPFPSENVRTNRRKTEGK